MDQVLIPGPATEETLHKPPVFPSPSPIQLAHYRPSPKQPSNSVIFYGCSLVVSVEPLQVVINLLAYPSLCVH